MEASVVVEGTVGDERRYVVFLIYLLGGVSSHSRFTHSDPGELDVAHGLAVPAHDDGEDVWVRPDGLRVRKVLFDAAALAPAFVHELVVHPCVERVHVRGSGDVERVEGEGLVQGGAMAFVDAGAGRGLGGALGVGGDDARGGGVGEGGGGGEEGGEVGEGGLEPAAFRVDVGPEERALSGALPECGTLEEEERDGGVDCCPSQTGLEEVVLHRVLQGRRCEHGGDLFLLMEDRPECVDRSPGVRERYSASTDRQRELEHGVFRHGVVVLVRRAHR